MVKLKKPENGATIDLLTAGQAEFLKTDRSEVLAEDFDWLDLKTDPEVDESFPKKTEFEWEPREEAVLEISENEAFENCFRQFGNGHCTVENLKCNTGYYWRVVLKNETSEVFRFDTADTYPRFIKIDGLTNVRDCGGRKTADGRRIKQGMLYRGSELNSHLDVSPDGLKTMRNVLKIKSVLDLRGETEVVRRVYDGGYVNIPAVAYAQWFDRPDIMRKIFEFISEEDNYPIYFHCWGGADRTGTLAFLLGALLGMSYDDLIDDYEITSLSIFGVRSRNSEKLCKSFLSVFDEFEGVLPSEKAKNYFLSCGISEEAIEKFKAVMLNG